MTQKIKIETLEAGRGRVTFGDNGISLDTDLGEIDYLITCLYMLKIEMNKEAGKEQSLPKTNQTPK